MDDKEFVYACARAYRDAGRYTMPETCAMLRRSTGRGIEEIRMAIATIDAYEDIREGE
jgi:hypothetical protein